jgi:hypothetical protein
MAFEPKPNKGTLFPNDFKTTEFQPNVKGDLFMDRDLLNALMIKQPDGLVKISISGWAGEWQGKKILKLVAQEPWSGESKPAVPVVSDDELPY